MLEWLTLDRRAEDGFEKASNHEKPDFIVDSVGGKPPNLETSSSVWKFTSFIEGGMKLYMHVVELTEKRYCINNHQQKEGGRRKITLSLLHI